MNLKSSYNRSCFFSTYKEIKMNEILIKILVAFAILVMANLFVYLTNLSKEKINLIENRNVREATSKLLDIIVKCVGATNQTFVNGLKETEGFDKAAQEEAWNDTKASIEKILDNESKEILGKAYGDLNDYINQALEDEVNRQKESK